MRFSAGTSSCRRIVSGSNAAVAAGGPYTSPFAGMTRTRSTDKSTLISWVVTGLSTCSAPSGIGRSENTSGFPPGEVTLIASSATRPNSVALRCAYARNAHASLPLRRAALRFASRSSYDTLPSSRSSS